MSKGEIILIKGRVIDQDGKLADIGRYVAPVSMKADFDDEGYPCLSFQMIHRIPSQMLDALRDIVMTNANGGFSYEFTALKIVGGQMVAQFSRGCGQVGERKTVREGLSFWMIDRPHVILPSTVLEGDPRTGPWELPEYMTAWLETNCGFEAVSEERVNEARGWNWAIAEIKPKVVKTLSDRFVASIVFHEPETAHAFVAKFGLKTLNIDVLRQGG
jgi:hypothetical protein